MAFSAFRDMRPSSQLVFSIFVILVCFLGFMVLSLVVAVPLFGMKAIMNLSSFTDLTNPETLQILKYFQVVQAIGLFILPAIVLAWLYYGNVPGSLFLNTSFNLTSVILVVVLMFFSGPFINFIGELNSRMVFPEWLSGVENWMKNSEKSAEKLTDAFVNVETTGGLFFNLFMIALLPAIGEEFLFRGVLQRIFTGITNNYHWGIWITAILFSALHMQFYGFVPRMILGVMFGYLLVWSGTMWLPVIAHFVNNAFAVVVMFMIHNNILNEGIDEIGSTNDSYYLAGLSLVLIVVFLLLIRKENEGRKWNV